MNLPEAGAKLVSQFRKGGGKEKFGRERDDSLVSREPTKSLLDLPPRRPTTPKPRPFPPSRYSRSDMQPQGIQA